MRGNRTECLKDAYGLISQKIPARLTLFENAKSSKPIKTYILKTREALRRFLETESERPRKRGLPLYSRGFCEGPRNKKKMVGPLLVLLDIDRSDVSLVECSARFDKIGVSHYGHTTWRHDPAKPNGHRYRIVTDIVARDWEILEAIVRELADATAVKVDAASWNGMAFFSPGTDGKKKVERIDRLTKKSTWKPDPGRLVFGKESGDRKPKGEASSEVDIDEVREALSFVTDNDGDRERWLEVGMALHSTAHPKARELWDEWSIAQESDKFDADDQERVWRSFSEEGNAGGKVGAGTIFHLAKAAGWKPSGRSSAREDFGFEEGRTQQASPGTAMPRTHAWNAERLVEEHYHELRYIEALGSWIRFDGKRWRMDRGLSATRFAMSSAKKIWLEATSATADSRDNEVRWASTSNKTSGIRGTIDLAKPGFELAANKLDANPMLLNVQNGTLDLRTHELRHHDPDDLITKVTPTAYVREARCEHWDRFLEEVLPDPMVRAFFQRLAGYVLQGGQSEKAYAIVHGPPDGGKSTAVTALARALGTSFRSERAPDDDDSAVVTRFYAESTPMSTFASQRFGGGNRPELAKLMGARMVIVNEILGEQLESSLMKSWTGGDSVAATPKYGHPLSFYPDGTIILVGNELPTIEFDDDAMWGRTFVVPFTTSIAPNKRVPNLIDRFDLDAVLTWMVEGHRLFKLFGLYPPLAVQIARETHRGDLDPLADFWNECVGIGEVDPEINQPARTSTRELYERYEDWSTPYGSRSMPRDALSQTQLTRYANKRAERTGEFRTKRSGAWRGWDGLYTIGGVKQVDLDELKEKRRRNR